MQGVMMPGADYLHAAQHEPGGIDALTGYLRLDQSTPQSLSASPIFNAGTATRVPFYSGTKTLTDSANLVFNNDILDTTAVNTDGLTVAATEIWVKPGTTIQATINAIIDASASKPYCVRVPPGVYTEVVYMKAYVSLKGCGRHCTKITYDHSSYASICTVHWNNMVTIEDMAIEATNVGIPIGDWNFIGNDLSNCTVTVNNCYLYGASDLSMCTYAGSAIHIYNCNCFTEWDGFGVFSVVSTYYIYNVDVEVDGSSNGVIGILRPYGGGTFYVHNLKITGSSTGSQTCNIISALYDPTSIIEMYNVEVDFTSATAVVTGIDSSGGSVVGYNCRIETSGAAGSYDLKRSTGSIELHNSNYTTTSGTIIGDAQIPGSSYIGVNASVVGTMSAEKIKTNDGSLLGNQLVDLYGVNIPILNSYTYGFDGFDYGTRIGTKFVNPGNATAYASGTCLLISPCANDNRNYFFIDGIYVEDVAKPSSAVITSAAGIWISSITAATTNWGLVSNKGYVFHGDKVLINPSVGSYPIVPSYELEVIGSVGITSQFRSSLAIGTAPLVVTSTTLCSNLNADLWDGYQFADYLDQAVKTTSGPTFTKIIINGVSSNAILIDMNATFASPALNSYTGIDMAMEVSASAGDRDFQMMGMSGSIYDYYGHNSATARQHIDRGFGLTFYKQATHTGSGNLTESIYGCQFDCREQSFFTGTGNDTVSLNGVLGISVFAPQSVSKSAGTLGVDVVGGYFTTQVQDDIVGSMVGAYTGAIRGIYNNIDISINSIIGDNGWRPTMYGNHTYINFYDYYGITDHTVYGYFLGMSNDAMQLDHVWAYYNDTTVDNFMGYDSSKTLFGTGKDASIYYDGTNLVVNPKEVGTGGMYVQGDVGINIVPASDTGLYVYKSTATVAGGWSQKVTGEFYSNGVGGLYNISNTIGAVTGSSISLHGLYTFAYQKSNISAGNVELYGCRLSATESGQFTNTSQIIMTSKGGFFQLTSSGSNSFALRGSYSGTDNVDLAAGHFELFAYPIFGKSAGGVLCNSYAAYFRNYFSTESYEPNDPETMTLTGDIHGIQILTQPTLDTMSNFFTWKPEIYGVRSTVSPTNAFAYVDPWGASAYTDINTYCFYARNNADPAEFDGIYSFYAYSGDWVAAQDNMKFWFGASKDASIYYDGTNMIINPKVVGSGCLEVTGNVGINKVADAKYALDITSVSTADYDIMINAVTTYTGTSKSHYGANLDIVENGSNTSGFNLRGIQGFTEFLGSMSNTTSTATVLEGTIFYTNHTCTHHNSGDLSIYLRGGFFACREWTTYNGTGADYVEAMGGYFYLDSSSFAVDKSAGSLTFNHVAGRFLNNFVNAYNYQQGTTIGEIFGVDSLVNVDIEGWDFVPTVYGVKSKIIYTEDATISGPIHYCFYADYEDNAITPADIWGFYNNTVGDVFVGGDSSFAVFGTGKDAYIVYDGTDLLINPKFVGTGVLDILGDLSLTAQNIITDTTTGTKVGTATNQKLGFWNSTPVVQDTGWTITNKSADRVLDCNATTLDELADVVGTLVDTLKSYGLLGG